MSNLKFLTSIKVDKVVSGSTCVTSPITCGITCVIAPTICGTITTISPSLKLTNVVAKTSETCVAYFKSDGTIVSGTSAGGTVTGGANGLSLHGNNVVLGGNLTGDTTISGNTTPYSLCLLGINNFCTTTTSLHLDATNDFCNGLNNSKVFGDSCCLILLNCFDATNYTKICMTRDITPDTAISIKTTTGCISLIADGTGNVSSGAKVFVYGQGGIDLSGGTGGTRIIGVCAKTSETSAAFFKSDGTIVSGTSTGGGMTWTGTTANGVGTYVSATCICSQPNLTFDGTSLVLTGNLGIGLATSIPLHVCRSIENVVAFFQNTHANGSGLGIQANNDANTSIYINNSAGSGRITMCGNGDAGFAGDVGVGTLAPVGNLNVIGGGSGCDTNVYIQNTGGGNSTHGLWFGNIQSTGGTGRYSGLMVDFPTDTFSIMHYSGGAGTAVERLSIDVNGVVNIPGIIEGEERIMIGSTGLGCSSLQRGTAVQSGYFEVLRPDTTRVGYIGWQTEYMSYLAEIGIHCFTGAVGVSACLDVATCICVGTNIIMMSGADRFIQMESIGAAAECDLIIRGQCRTALNAGSGTAGHVYLEGGGSGCFDPAVGGFAIVRGGAGTGASSGSGGDVLICGGAGTATPGPGGGVGGDVCILGGIGDGGGGTSTCGCVRLHFGTTLALHTISGGVCVTGVLNSSGVICSTTSICANTFVDGNTCVMAGSCVAAVTRVVGACAVGTTCVCTPIAVASTCVVTPAIATAANLSLLVNTTESALVATANGTTALYYDNAAKMCTLTNGGCFIGCGFATDFVAASDVRLKKEIKPISNALSLVTQLQGVCYKLCEDCFGENRIGLIAQDVEKIMPEVVGHSEPSDEDAKYGITDDKLGIKYDKIVSVLIEAIKEQQVQITDLKTEINNLKNNTL